MISIKKLGANIAVKSGFLELYSLIRKFLLTSQKAIFMYHRVDPNPPPWFPGAVTLKDFEKEIAYLCKVANVVSLDWFVDRFSKNLPVPERAVCITFDDGWKDNYTWAYPILRKYTVPATIFLTTGYIGSDDTFWECRIRNAIWNTKVKQLIDKDFGRYSLVTSNQKLIATNRIQSSMMKLFPDERNILETKLYNLLQYNPPNDLGRSLSLSWEEVLEMSQNGISFGAHTVTHQILTRLPNEEAIAEISNSKKDIEERLGKPCSLFAYPNGDFNDEIVGLVKESGFASAVTTVPKLLNTKQNNLFSLPRISAGPDFYTFKGCYSGLYPDLMSF